MSCDRQGVTYSYSKPLEHNASCLHIQTSNQGLGVPQIPSARSDTAALRKHKIKTGNGPELGILAS